MLDPARHQAGRKKGRSLYTRLLCLAMGILFTLPAAAQCPPNLSFNLEELTNWSAYTAYYYRAPNVIRKDYPAGQAFPNGTTSASIIPEQGILTAGIKVNSTPTTDVFGGFTSIPVINGYTYNHSVTLGSTSFSDPTDIRMGGYRRGISYQINVPPGAATDPYTLTYAYALVLENGSHTTVEQPIFKATVTDPAGNIINCLSASYNLPTKFDRIRVNPDNSIDSIFVLDAPAAARQGFRLSTVPSPNDNGNVGETKIRVFTKDWTEVSFNLAPYRGQTVTLTFNSDNCIPGGHFCYAYLALRNDCGGLKISGPDPACAQSNQTYSIPSLANATYAWTLPPGWTSNGSATSNQINVTTGTTGGQLLVTADNGCTKLAATAVIDLTPPTLAGTLGPDARACQGPNSNLITLTGNRGDILQWISSTDSVNWTPIGNAGNTTYTAAGLTRTTYYSAVVQYGAGCSKDSSTAAVIRIDPLSAAGPTAPATLTLCLNQDKNNTVTLQSSTGNVENWETSPDNLIWTDLSPAVASSTLNITNTGTPATFYARPRVRSGVCPAVEGPSAKINILGTPFPNTSLDPRNVLLCYGDTARLNVIATDNAQTYKWLNTQDLTDLNPTPGVIGSTPSSFTALAYPRTSTIYPISISNAICPYPRLDTFFVGVRKPIGLSAGRDTAIVLGQQLQLFAQVNNPDVYNFTWTPPYGLSNTNIQDPIATIGAGVDSIRYRVKVVDNALGCMDSASIRVIVFQTGPDIFVPSGFTPNGDGLNDVLRAIPVGISQFDYLRIYDRFGTMVFSTSDSKKGWDGSVKGTPSATATFAWTVRGTDYTGKLIAKKGTVTLIR